MVYVLIISQIILILCALVVVDDVSRIRNRLDQYWNTYVPEEDKRAMREMER